MEWLARCAPPRVRVAPAALIALLLLIGLVADGGASTPSRSDLDRPATASPAQDRSAPRPARGRDGAWEVTATADRPEPEATQVPAAAVHVASALVISTTPGRRPASPASRRRVDLRRRGPPSLPAL